MHSHAIELHSRTMAAESPEERYARPLIWIGLYVAGASLVCAVLMTMDLLHSLGRRKLWIAPKFFALNAATLTLLGVATKLPSDITTEMEKPLELMTKLSGVFFICIAMNQTMPCLNLMDGLGILSSVVALGILVITTFVNIMIQLSTGILEHDDFNFYFAVFSAVMLLKFVIFVSYSLTVTTTIKVLKQEYNIRHEKIVQETVPDGKLDGISQRKMENILKKYWLMALTSSPDFTVLSSGMCSVSGTLDWIGILIPLYFFMAVLDKSEFRSTLTSDYKWSPLAIFPIQVAGISVGIVGSLLRVAKSRPTSEFSSLRALFKIDSHWVFLLRQWREAPLPFSKILAKRRLRKTILGTKNLTVDVLIVLQIVVIVVSKLLLFFMRCLWGISIGWAWTILKNVVTLCCIPFSKAKNTSVHRAQPRCNYKFWIFLDNTEVENEGVSLDLRCFVEYVLHLEKENKNNDIHAMRVVSQWHKYPMRWINSGRANRPAKVLHFLRRHCRRWIDLEELGRPYDKLVVQLRASRSEGRLPSRCWSLPIATLAAIAQTLATPEQKQSVMSLMGIISEGLIYVRFVEEKLGTCEALKKQKAADVVWEGIDLRGRWLDVDLNKMISLDWGSTISRMDNIAERQLQQGNDEKKLKWPSRLLAAACMRDVVRVLLSDTSVTEGKPLCLRQLYKLVAYLLGACLFNLPLAIFAQCSSGNFGEREEAVKKAALVLGETEEILKWLSENDGMLNFYTAHRETMRLPSIADEYVSSQYGL